MLERREQGAPERDTRVAVAGPVEVNEDDPAHGHVRAPGFLTATLRMRT